MSENLPKSGFTIPKDGDPKNTWGDANITGDLDQANGVGLLPAIDEIIGEMYETPTDILTSDLKLNAKLSTGATGDDEVQILNDTQNIVKSLKLGSGIDSVDGGDYIEISTSTGNLTKESTGFKEGCIVSYNSTTRTVTLTGTVDAYWRNEKITELVTGWESSAHPENPTNSQFLYYNGTSFVWSSTPWDFSELQICAVSFDSAGSLIVALNETHGFMPHECHREDHFNIGTHREGGTSAGGVASSYVLSSTVAADRRPIISACTIKDEDLITTLPILNNSLYCQAHLTGSNGNVSISVDQTDIVPLNGSRPYYNNFTGGVWIQTALSNNDYMNIWCMAIPATSDAETQKKRFIFWQGTEEYSTSSAALNENIQDYDFGEFTNAVAESTIILQFTIFYTGGNWRIFNVKDIVGNRLLQLGATTSAFNYDTFPYNPLITPPAVLVEGTTYYDEIKHNLVVQSGGDTNLDVGRECLAPARVYNNTGATIANNTPISLTTFNDSTKTWNFVKADAVTNNKNIHITTQSIVNLSMGEAIKRGAINDAITTGYTNGQVLYLSDTAGTYSTTSGTNKIIMGKVAVVSATIGRFDAEIGYSLDEYRKLTNNNFDDRTKVTGTDATIDAICDSTGGGSSRVRLLEDFVNGSGLEWKYNSATNKLELNLVTGFSSSTKYLEVDRDTGIVTFYKDVDMNGNDILDVNTLIIDKGASDGLHVKNGNTGAASTALHLIRMESINDMYFNFACAEDKSGGFSWGTASDSFVSAMNFDMDTRDFSFYMNNKNAGYIRASGVLDWVYGISTSGTITASGLDTTSANKEVVVEYADNAAAIAAGLAVGTHYRTGDLLKIVH